MCNSRVLIAAEMAALAWALKKGEKFLKGAKEFTLYTDHKPLVPLINKKRLNEVPHERLRSKLMQIADFNFTAKYIKGSENVVADVFSRQPVSVPTAEERSESEDIMESIGTIQTKAIDISESQCDLKLQEIKEVANEDIGYQKLKDTRVDWGDLGQG